jgi:hypothetical protein
MKVRLREFPCRRIETGHPTEKKEVLFLRTPVWGMGGIWVISLGANTSMRGGRYRSRWSGGLPETGGTFCAPAIKVPSDVFAEGAGADKGATEGSGELARGVIFFEAFKQVEIWVVLAMAQFGEGGGNARKVLVAVDLGFEFHEFLAFVSGDHDGLLRRERYRAFRLLAGQFSE